MADQALKDIFEPRIRVCGIDEVDIFGDVVDGEVFDGRDLHLRWIHIVGVCLEVCRCSVSCIVDKVTGKDVHGGQEMRGNSVGGNTQQGEQQRQSAFQ